MTGWFVHLEGVSHPAPDAATLASWAQAGRFGRETQVFNPSTSEWSRADSVPEIAAVFDRRTRKWLAVFAAALAVLIVTAAVLKRIERAADDARAEKAAEEQRRNAEAKAKRASEAKTVALDLPFAEEALRQGSLEKAAEIATRIASATDGLRSLHQERSKALAIRAVALASLGEESCEAAFLDYFRHDSNVAKPYSWQDQKIQSRYDSALAMFREEQEATAQRRMEREQQAAAERSSREEKDRLREVAKRLGPAAKDFVESERPGAEGVRVGEPYLNGGFWCVQLTYVLDDTHGRRAKVTVVRFSPITYEIVDASDLV